jgi:hypothetical protein
VRGCVRVREIEMRRGIRAATLEGLVVDRIDIATDGRAFIIISHGNGKQEAAPEVNEWDKPHVGRK